MSNEVRSAILRIDDAVMVASETHSSYEERCHAIMNALGIDFGGYDKNMSDKFLGSDVVLVLPYLRDRARDGDEEAKTLLNIIRHRNTSDN